jgi:chromate transporter
MKVDALAFGGGFASVPLMYREIVTSRSWIDAKTFMDGIALGQVTPGPIVITATFVGYQVGGLAGALVATAAIFFPSFVLVLVAAPSFSALRVRPWFEPGLHGALLSFVGLLVFVTLQFAGAVDWTVGAGILAAVALAALLAGIDVLWVVLGAGGIAAIAL